MTYIFFEICIYTDPAIGGSVGDIGKQPVL